MRLTGRAENGAPARAESPVPKMVSARPVAVWLVDRLRVRSAKIIETESPANAPHSSAT
ncbi:hypothetical protein D3C73_1674020 [compost metagenome]